MKNQKVKPSTSRENKKPENKLRESGLKVPENYERFFVPVIGRPIAQDFVRLAELRSGEQVLDAACGTGIVARLAFDQTGDEGKVVGVDNNPGMLAVAKSIAPSIEWHEASVEALPFPGETFDVVLCQLGLQFVEDKSTALKEMRRVLKSGGRLFLNMPGPAGPLFAIFSEELKKFIGPQAAEFVNRVFSMNDSSEIQQLIENAGFREVSVQAKQKMLTLPAPKEFLWQYIQSTPLLNLVSQASEEARTSLEQEIVKRWHDFVEDNGMKYRQRMITATARI